jgi:hypothetical protein
MFYFCTTSLICCIYFTHTDHNLNVDTDFSLETLDLYLGFENLTDEYPSFSKSTSKVPDH